MTRAMRLRWVVGLIALPLALGLPVGNGAPPRRAVAQDFACPPAATPTASSAASPVAALAASTNPIAFPDEGGELTIFAAASLTAAFEQIAADLEAANSRLTITFNFAGSQALVTQLSEGAKADVFASANPQQMETAVANGVIAGEPVTFTQNRLAIIVPADNPAGLEAAADLAREGLQLVLAAPEVPVGRYAREAICKMGDDPSTYGEGFVDAVTANIVSNEDNVKAVLTKVQLGEADAGIVYTTDVTADVADEVRQIEIPAAVNVVATYPIAMVAGGDEALAGAFIAYVLGPAGQAVLQEFGFEPRL